MKKYLSVILVILLFSFVGCKTNNDVSSDFSSFSSETKIVTSNVKDSSQVTNDESNNVTSTVPLESTIEDSSSESSSVPTDNQTPVTTPAPTPTHTLSAREKMTGEWRYILPENKHTADVYAFVGHRLVYDIKILDDNTILLSEKHYKRSDFDTIGAVEYFEGKRYTLVYSSQDIIPDSFKGEISISTENKNTAIINISGYEIASGKQLIREKHYLTLTDDGKLSWEKAELLSEGFDKQYFPWDKETVFIKK